MKNLKKTAFKVISTAALMATVATPVVVSIPASSFAAGSGSVSAYSVPTISNSVTSTGLGTASVTVPAGALSGVAGQDTVTVSLPHGFTLSDANLANGIQFGAKNASNQIVAAGTNFSVTETQGSQAVTGTVYGIPTGQTLNGVATYSGVRIVVNSVNGVLSSTTDDNKFNVAFNNVNVNGPASGAVNLTLDAPSNSAFPAGNVTVANVQTNGVVDLAAANTTSGSDNFTFNLDLKEEIAGSLKDSNGVKLKLPSGYVWNTGLNGTAIALGSVLYGDSNAKYDVSGDGSDTLYISVDPKYNNGATTQATSLQIPLKFTVNDDTQVKTGPINLYVSGTSSTNVSTLQVGQYGDYSASVTAASTPDIYAGQYDQQIGDLTIKESVPGTFISGRTVELTLPDNSRWEDVFEAIAKNSGNTPSSAPTPNLNISTTNGLSVTPTFSGTDYRTLKLTFSGNGSAGNTDPGEIDLKNVQIATSARAKGDIAVTVGGTAGVSGTVKVATGNAVGTIAVSKVANIVPGKGLQALPDITVTEAKAGAFSTSTVTGGPTTHQIKVSLAAAAGAATAITWDAIPKIAVTSGDAAIDNAYTSNGDLYVTLTSASGATPATISITGGVADTDNTLAAGPIAVKLKGTAVDYAANTVNAWANDTTTAAATTIANVGNGTAAGNHVVFTIGKSNYSLNGTDTTLDAPAFIDANGRTQLPVRALSEALGATVGWDQDSQTVSVLKDGKAIAITVGASKMNVGGVPVALDSAAVNKDGRVFLPFRAIAEALGATVAWDATSQTVTLN